MNTRAKSRDPRYYFGLTINEFFSLCFLSAVFMLVTYPLYSRYSLWTGMGMAFFVFIIGHMLLIAQRSVCMPELICFIAAINWVVAPWLAYLYPADFPLYRMSVPQQVYFAYTVPATVALWLGIHIPLRLRVGEADLKEFSKMMSPNDRLFMDSMIIFSCLVTLTANGLPFQGLRFFYYILEQLKFVAALSLMFTSTRGWGVRVFFVYLILFLQTTAGGVFYEFVLWSGYLFISLAYLRRWRWRLLIYISIVIVLITALNGVKSEYRAHISYEELPIQKKISLLGDLLWDELAQKNSDSVALGDRVVRWNQGWIISRAMAFVPAAEPYAHGETIKDALFTAIVPRVFAPNKAQAASKDFFRRFTGLQLAKDTAMALGIAGEMYVNFGSWGGVLMTGLYGIMIGFIFSRFARFAKRNVLWWAWMPSVLLVTLEAEWNLADILNHMTKSFLVMIVIIYCVPIFKRRLFVR